MTYGSNNKGSYFKLTHEENARLLAGETITHLTQASFGDFRFKLTMEVIHLYDRKRDELHVGDSVVVIDPEGPEDTWNHEFQGTIKAINGKTLLVTDQDDNDWPIISSLKVVKDH